MADPEIDEPTSPPPPERRDGEVDRRHAERRAGKTDRRHPIRTFLKHHFTVGRGYRDVWLIGITLLVWISLESNDDTVASIQASRVETLWGSCLKGNEQVDGLNGLATALQGIVLSGAALPGDRPSPITDPLDPSKWTKITPGPLSQDLERQFPQLPDASERLAQAQRSAEAIEARKVERRECEAEVRAIGGDPSTLPQPSPTISP